MNHLSPIAKLQAITTLLGLKGLTMGFCAIAVFLGQRLPERPEVLVGMSAAAFVSACFGLATIWFLKSVGFGHRERISAGLSANRKALA
jgi:hypothetical protein